jgi:hypothetical protein
MNTWYKLIKKYSWFRHIYNLKEIIKNSFIDDYNAENKVFVIGLNKTGTTTMEKVLKDLGYKLGNQADAELLTDYILKKRYIFLYKYIKTANAFQDLPFSLRNIYKLIYKKYPHAKYILTVRNDEMQWLNSLENFTKKRFESECKEKIDLDNILLEDMKKLNYRYKNMSYNNFRRIWHGDKNIIFSDTKLFDEEYCKYYYNKHIEEVKNFFQGKNNLLIINVEKKDSYKELCEFLDKKTLYDEFPHLNRTKI